MIINGDHLIEFPKCDVVVIGSGPAGLAISSRLAENGVSVLLLEAGELVPTPESQKYYQGEETGIAYPLAGSRTRAFGGSSNCWGGWCRRLEEIEFLKRPWIDDSEWPISADLEERYYSDAAEFLGIEGKNYDPKYWAAQCGRPSASIFDGSIAFESRVWQLAVNKRLGIEMEDFIKNSRLITMVYNCCLTKLVCEDGRVSAFQCRTTGGKSFQGYTDKYILAMGALENARILMTSGLQDIIGSQWLGKGFMEHPARINGLRLYVHSNSLNFMEYNGGATFEPPEKGFRVAFGFGLTPSSQIKNKITGFWGVISERIENLSPAEVSKANHLLSLQGIKGNRVVVAHDITWAIEQAPKLQSAISLSEDRDHFGLNKLKLNWAVSDLDISTVNFSLEALAADLIKRKVGVVRKIKGISYSDLDIDYGHHHIGTVRMGGSPRDGVVDKNCKVFGIDNLYCAGSGVFPTSAVTNPTLALTAFSFRLAEYLLG